MVNPIIFIFIVPVFVTLSQLCLKRGVAGLGELNFSFWGMLSLIPRILQNAWLMAGLVLLGISFLFYLFALSKTQLNILYPVMVSFGILLITLTSWIFLKTPLSWPQILGIVTLILGIFLLTPRT